jgi:hypothetical protein
MRVRQISDMLGVEEGHKLEFELFNEKWDKQMVESEGKSEG